jgi:hypothetical protein
MDDLIKYQQMLAGVQQAYSEQLQELQDPRKEGRIQAEEGGGVMGLFTVKQKIIDAFKNRINKKVEDLTQQAKDKAQEFVEGAKDKAEEVAGQIQERAQGAIDEARGAVQGLQEQAGEALGQVQQGVEGIAQQAGQALGQVRQVSRSFKPLSNDDYEQITSQVKADTEAFKNQLVPRYEEQDEFDLEGERILKGANNIMDRMSGLDQQSAGYRALGRVLDRQKQQMIDVMDRKEAETGTRELRLNRDPTEDEYKQIEDFASQRHQELLEQKSAELNPPQEAQPPTGQIGESQQLSAPAEQTGQIGEEAQPVTQEVGGIAETSFSTAGKEAGEAVGKEAGEAVGEGIGEELGAESALASIPGVGEILAPLAFLGTALTAIFGHKKTTSGPVMAGVSSQFGG